MKLTTLDISNLNNIINVCALANIDMLLLDATVPKPLLSGINADRTCVIITNDNIPSIQSGEKLALKKFKILKSRLDLFKADPKLSVETKSKPNGDISELHIKGTNASVQFRTVSSNAVQCPKAIDDVPTKVIKITREEVALILNAEKAMGSKKVTISIKSSNAVSVEFTDANNDLFSIGLSNPALDATDESSDTSVVAYYYSDVFTSLIKAAVAEDDSVEVSLYESSSQIVVNGYTMILISPMDSE